MGFHLAWLSLNTLFLGGARSLAMSVRVVLSYFNVSNTPPILLVCSTQVF